MQADTLSSAVKEGYRVEVDKILVRDVLKGNMESFDQLIQLYYHKVYSFLKKHGLSNEDAEDLSQETFIKIHNNLFRYDEAWCFSTWVFKIAINSYKDFMKKCIVKTQDLNEDLVSSFMQPQIDNTDGIYFKELLSKIFNSLELINRQMMLLHYFHGLSMKEIGKIYGKSAEAVKMKIFRARSRLGAEYGKLLNGGEDVESM